MNTKKIKNGDYCQVIAGTHIGKFGLVSDLNISKTGHVTITVTQINGVRFKTLAKNVLIKK
jgi:ribosomal protein S4E